MSKEWVEVIPGVCWQSGEYQIMLVKDRYIATHGDDPEDGEHWLGDVPKFAAGGHARGEARRYALTVRSEAPIFTGGGSCLSDLLWSVWLGCYRQVG